MPVALHYNTIQTGAVSAFLEDNESGNESIRLLFLLHIYTPCYTPVHLKKNKKKTELKYTPNQEVAAQRATPS